MKNRRGSKDPNGIARTLCEWRFGKFFHFLENSASNYVFSASSTLSMRFITFLRFDFYFQGRITSRWTRFFDPSSERLTGSQGPEPTTTIKRFAVARTTRDWFPSLFATAKSIRTAALWKSSGYILGENLQIDATNRDAWFVVPAGDN